MKRIVIAGAGQAGVQLAESLRSEGNTSPIVLLSDETGLPYQRPPLSKDHLGERSAPEPLPIKAARFFAEQNITLLDGNSIVGIDRTARTVMLSDDTPFNYTDLVLATGARNRPLDVSGGRLAGIHYLRTAADATTLRAALLTARTAVVVGAGFIGLEFAAVARSRGLEVTVLEHGPQAMGGAISEQMCQHLTESHLANGVRFVFDETVTAFEGDGTRVSAVLGRSGERYPADVVLIGIGVVPNTDLATAAGLSVSEGISVDTYLRTADEHVWAIGDCAQFPCAHAETPARRGSVQNAIDHARALAKTLSGVPTEYREVPWFWSHQGEIRLQIVGVARPADHCELSGDPTTGKFAVLRFHNNMLTGVESVNNPGIHMAGRRVLAAGSPTTITDARQAGFDLKSLAAQVSTTKV